MKREPDSFGMYVHNDFASYGVREVIDNMVGFLRHNQGAFAGIGKLLIGRVAAAAQKPKSRKPAAEKKTAWRLSDDVNNQGKRLWRKWDWKREVCIMSISSLESS